MKCTHWHSQHAAGPAALTFQGHPVVLPLPAGSRLHLLILLVYQEVLDCQRASLAHGALRGRQQDVRLAWGAEGTATLFIAVRRAGLLQALAVGGAHLQFPPEVLVHPLACSIPRRTAAAVAAHKGSAGGRRVAGVGGIRSPGQEVRVGGGPFDPTVCEFAALSRVNILGNREGERSGHASRAEGTREYSGPARGSAVRKAHRVPPMLARSLVTPVHCREARGNKPSTTPNAV